MNYCAYLEDYLNNVLTAEQQGVFVAHLEHCEACSTQVAKCNILMAAVGDWSNRQVVEGPTSAEAARLVVGLRPRDSVGGIGRRTLYWGVAACVAIALGFMVYPGQKKSATKPAPVAKAERLPIKVLFSKDGELLGSDDVTGSQLSVPGDGHLVIGLGSDQVGLDNRTGVEVLKANPRETRIKLLKGAVAVAVKPRDSQKGKFAVEAGGFLVTVVGTRFKVSLDGPSSLRVAVGKGQVMVSGPAKTRHQVKAGQTLIFSPSKGWAIASIEADEILALNGLLTVPPIGVGNLANPPIDDGGPGNSAEDHAESDPGANQKSAKVRGNPTIWRKWILNGRYRDAQRALTGHLQTHPQDVAGWSMLADCYRKAGKWKPAVRAYRQIVAKGNAKAANSARFEAAVLLQDKLGNHAAAARLLSAYLEAPLLLEADAMVRLAQAELKQGKSEQAAKRLKQVITRYRGTSAAIQARRILDN